MGMIILGYSVKCKGITLYKNNCIISIENVYLLLGSYVVCNNVIPWNKDYEEETNKIPIVDLIQYRRFNSAPVDRTSANAWLYKHLLKT